MSGTRQQSNGTKEGTYEHENLWGRELYKDLESYELTQVVADRLDSQVKKMPSTKETHDFKTEAN